MAKQFDIREVLEQSEIDQIASFNESPILVQAVKKALLMPIYYQGTLPRGKKLPDLLLNWILGFLISDPKASDADIGREVRIRQAATDMLDTSFKELEKIRRQVELPPQEKKSR